MIEPRAKVNLGVELARKLACHIKAQACTPRLARPVVLASPEFIENTLLVGLTDANTTVLDRKFECIILLCDP